jgi:DNA-directed RNA polymerase sigma subunit (sigma70/sigma32)
MGRTPINFMKKSNIEAEQVEAAYQQFRDLLSPREKEVLTRYYGIEPNVRHSLREISEMDMFHVTRERIRQIKTVALKKIKIIKPQ